MFELTRRTSFGILLVTIGGAFAVAGLTLWFVAVRPQTTELNQAVLGIIVHVLFGYIVLMAGIVVYRSELPLSQCFIAAKWCLGGAAFMGVLVLWRAVSEISSGTVTLGLVNELVIVGSVGAAAGVLVGLNRGQAVRNSRLIEEKKHREETLVFLLQLLEHDIQNHVIAISNHADSIRPSTFDPSPTAAEAIEERTENIERLLETANVVLESETNDGTSERIDVSMTLLERVGVVESGAPDVEIHTDIDEGLYVDADRFVGEIFGNLLDNSIVHNDTEGLTIDVSAKANDGWIDVEIADDGDGISTEIRTELFEPGVRSHTSPGDGIGLYLVKKLVDAYDGRVSVSDRPEGGTRFRLRLPRAPEDGADGS